MDINYLKNIDNKRQLHLFTYFSIIEQAKYEPHTNEFSRGNPCTLHSAVYILFHGYICMRQDISQAKGE